MPGFHLSEDGVVRICRAESRETCTAVGPNGERAEHFDDIKSGEDYRDKIFTEEYGIFPKIREERPHEYYASERAESVLKKVMERYESTPGYDYPEVEDLYLDEDSVQLELGEIDGYRVKIIGNTSEDYEELRDVYVNMYNPTTEDEGEAEVDEDSKLYDAVYDSFLEERKYI